MDLRTIEGGDGLPPEPEWALTEKGKTEAKDVK